MNRKYAIIVAGGTGSRAGGGIPKQFRDLCGMPVFLHSVRAFLKEDADTHIIVVTHRDWRETARKGLERLHGDFGDFRYSVADGGSTRWESVRNGLNEIEVPEDTFIAVHDGARPLVSVETIRAGWETARRKDAAVACVPVTDSLREINADGSSRSVDRARFMAVQTPQVFNALLLTAAYRQEYSPLFTDDASVVEAFGHPAAIFKGSYDNIKITTPKDFGLAELILRERYQKD